MAEKDQEIETDRFPYRREKAILSPAELALFQALVVHLDSQYVICPKVRLGDIFTSPRKKCDRFYRYKINQKHVDFLLCAASTMSPLLGIELDDSTHDRKVRQERDQFVDDVYDAAGLPLLHIRATATYDSTLVASLVREALRNNVTRKPVNASVVDTPLCPKCGVKMRLRWPQKGPKRGDAFWGCPNFPACSRIMKP